MKTDKRDAQTLARLLPLDEVTEARVPSESQEALRELSRARPQAQKALTHQRQQLNALLLRHRRRYNQGSKWTEAHLTWLGKQAQACEYAAVIYSLMCLRGIQVTTAFGPAT